MLEVRFATMDDAMDLLRWKNDPDTRKFSIIAKDEIRVEDHLKWLSKAIQSPTVRLYMILKDGFPVGDIRFDIGDEIEVSVRIDRPYRNQGIGSWAVSTIGQKEMDDIKRPFMAKIVEGNKISMRIFTKNGFILARHESGISYLTKRYVRKVTAILTKYKRPRELNAIIDNLKYYDFIDEILICDNTKHNQMSYARYEKMHLSRNDIIYLQDDDCIIKGLQKLYEIYDGKRLINGFKAERMHLYPNKDTMLGWGAFLDRRWTYDPISRYIGIYGRDYILMREADRIFTALMKVPKLTIPILIKDFPSAMSTFALSLQQDHEKCKALALARCRKIMQKEVVSV